MPEPYDLEDPVVKDLADFLRRTPLSNGAFAPIPGIAADYIAQAITNYSLGVAWDAAANDWVNLKRWEAKPELKDVEVAVLENRNDPNENVVRMTHKLTGISVLAEDADAGWRELQEKVRNASRSD